MQYETVLTKHRNSRANPGLKLLERRYNTELLALYKQKFPRRKLCPNKADTEFGDQLFEKYKPLVDRISEKAVEARSRWKQWLDYHSQVAAPVISNETTEIYCTTEHDYRSQGYGARKYAQGAAKGHLYSWAAAFPELTFQLVEEFIEYDQPIRCHDGYLLKGYWSFRVLVNTDDTGCDIITRRKVDMKEHYRALLKAGCNPRVSNPWLDNGFPESWGLDWFGNDLISKETSDE